jgi:hypothetical protein
VTQFPADPPFGEIVSGHRPERKSSPASVLAAPRTPVTRWNRKYLAAGAAALAAVVGLGFYLGFGGANAVPKKAQDPQAAADTDNPERPEIANRYVQGYADPAVRGGHRPVHRRPCRRAIFRRRCGPGRGRSRGPCPRLRRAARRWRATPGGR